MLSRRRIRQTHHHRSALHRASAGTATELAWLAERRRWSINGRRTRRPRLSNGGAARRQTRAFGRGDITDNAMAGSTETSEVYEQDASLPSNQPHRDNARTTHAFDKEPCGDPLVLLGHSCGLAPAGCEGKLWKPHDCEPRHDTDNQPPARALPQRHSSRHGDARKAAGSRIVRVQICAHPTTVPWCSRARSRSSQDSFW